MYNFIAEIFQYLVLVPAAIFCYIPMRNQIKLRKSRLVLLIGITMTILIPVCAAISAFTNINSNVFIMFIIAAAYIAYHCTLKVEIGRSLSMFLLVCALMTFPAGFSIIFDSRIHPNETLNDICIAATAFQCALSFILLGAFGWASYKYFSRIVDRLPGYRLWYLITPFPVLLLIINIYSLPQKNETLHVNRIFQIYIMILICELLFLLFVCVIFYFISMEILKHEEASMKVQFFEMQAKQYKVQQNYFNETARLRHDFRQSIYLLKELSDENNYVSLKDYLNKYVEQYPKHEYISYCKNPALNALLNYYRTSEKDKQIASAWAIDLPDNPGIPDTDLCSLLGNILENAINGCLTTAADKRYHKLSITLMHNASMYIVSVNSFNGKVSRHNDTYKSINGTGHGFGLSSISMTAERYNGHDSFSHTATEFSADIVMEITQ